MRRKRARSECHRNEEGRNEHEGSALRHQLPWAIIDYPLLDLRDYHITRPPFSSSWFPAVVLAHHRRLRIPQPALSSDLGQVCTRRCETVEPPQ